MSDFHFAEKMREFDNGYNGPWEFYSKLFIEGNGKTLQDTYQNKFSIVMAY